MKHALLETIQSPADVRRLSRLELQQLADELRDFVVQSVSQTGGHLSSNLGTVELTIALHPSTTRHTTAWSGTSGTRPIRTRY